jgi:hypothetical protein
MNATTLYLTPEAKKAASGRLGATLNIPTSRRVTERQRELYQQGFDWPTSAMLALVEEKLDETCAECNRKTLDRTTADLCYWMELAQSYRRILVFFQLLPQEAL